MGIRKLEGYFNVPGLKIGIVVSRWNYFITERLQNGAIDIMKRHGLKEDNITIAYCPGSFEIPLTAQKLLETNKYDGIICLGVVIRGATPHFDFVAGAVTNGVSNLNLKFGLPVSFGVLTTDTIDQALERAGTKSGNKGEEAALALLEMISLLNEIK
ncbi:MAG: 6,7-dimethyl-8-ribityllumazine synthase [Balneolales bacterium]